MKVKDRTFRSKELYSMFAYSTKIFLSIFEMLGIVLGLKVRTVNKTDRDLALQHLTFL